MNKYKTFEEMKEELGENYDTKLYALGISALKKIEELQHRIDKALEYLKSYNTDFKHCRFGEAPISMRELQELLEILGDKENENNK